MSFRFASTMPEIPHEYVVRSPDNEAAYVALFNAIMQYGVYESWAGRRKPYLYPGDGRKYWAMTTKLYESGVINRMKIGDDLERLRREELDPTSRRAQRILQCFASALGTEKGICCERFFCAEMAPILVVTLRAEAGRA